MSKKIKLFKAVKYTAIIVSLVMAILGLLMTWSISALASNVGAFMSPSITGAPPVLQFEIDNINYLAAPYWLTADLKLDILNGSVGQFGVGDPFYAKLLTVTGNLSLIPFDMNKNLTLIIDMTGISFVNLSAHFTFTGEVSIGPYFKWIGVYFIGDVNLWVV